jgi:hypothetical protein
MLIGFNICLQDNVFVNVVASIQYRALADKANDAFYKLSNTRNQIQAYVFDGINYKPQPCLAVHKHAISGLKICKLSTKVKFIFSLQ